MISIAMLEDNDVIQAGDFVRQLSLIYTGQSDYLATNATYGGSPMNRLGWIPAKYMCPAWVNKTVGEFNQVMMGRDRHATEKSIYEFIRGAVPKSHCEKFTREELKIADMIWS